MPDSVQLEEVFLLVWAKVKEWHVPAGIEFEAEYECKEKISIRKSSFIHEVKRSYNHQQFREQYGANVNFQLVNIGGGGHYERDHGFVRKTMELFDTWNQSTESVEITKNERCKIKIPAGTSPKHMCAYQLVGPATGFGCNFRFSYTKLCPAAEHIEPIKLVFTYRLSPGIPLLRHIRVLQLNSPMEQGNNAIVELNGGNNDINCGYGGKYVYIEAESTYNPKDALTNIQFIRQGAAAQGYSDLAIGAGGDYRYILETRAANAQLRVGSVMKLLRSKNAVTVVRGWNKTADINEGRGGDYLYLLYKEVPV